MSKIYIILRFYGVFDNRGINCMSAQNWLSHVATSERLISVVKYQFYKETTFLKNPSVQNPRFGSTLKPRYEFCT